ncbi:MAG: hypothetical protein ACR2MB_14155 [Acidimicrobiales bacterium]
MDEVDLNGDRHLILVSDLLEPLGEGLLGRGSEALTNMSDTTTWLGTRLDRATLPLMSSMLVMALLGLNFRGMVSLTMNAWAPAPVVPLPICCLTR